MKFPSIERITSYARAKDLARLPIEELLKLRENGLTRIHSGYESGSNEVLQLINKGLTQEEEIIAGKKVKDAGIEFSLYFMPGIGGKTFSDENALGMAKVVSEVNPDFIRVRTTAIKKGTELHEDYQKGNFILASDDDKIKEIETLILESNSLNTALNTQIKSDHIINLLPDIEGGIIETKSNLLQIINEYFELNEKEKKIFQYARRENMINDVRSLKYLDVKYKEDINKIIQNVRDEKEWDEMINNMICNYI